MEKKEFDAEIEATEDQETVDPETGITLSEVMQEESVRDTVSRPVEEWRGRLINEIGRAHV